MTEGKPPHRHPLRQAGGKLFSRGHTRMLVAVSMVSYRALMTASGPGCVKTHAPF